MSFGSAHAADLGPSQQQVTAGKPDLWIVTIGGYAVIEPDFRGSDSYSAGFKPIIGFHKAGQPEPVTFAGDGLGIAIIDTGTFKAGPVVKIGFGDDGGPSKQGFRRIHDDDFTAEVGAFLELWPAHFARLRAELRAGAIGSEGFVADLAADLVWRPDARWTFTVGPRVTIGNDDYNNYWFGASALGQPTFTAGGGVQSYGVASNIRYKWSDSWSTHAFVEAAWLTNSASRSPLTDDDQQIRAGIGFAYSFSTK